MGKMSTKSVDYFEMFQQGVSISLEAAQALQAAFRDRCIVESELKSIKDIEHKGDTHVHQCLRKIDIAFITPIDRTDIVDIIKAIENLTDCIDAVANHIAIFNIRESSTYLRRFVDYIVQCCKKLDELMAALKNFKRTTPRSTNASSRSTGLRKRLTAPTRKACASSSKTRRTPSSLSRKKSFTSFLSRP